MNDSHLYGTTANQINISQLAPSVLRLKLAPLGLPAVALIIGLALWAGATGAPAATDTWSGSANNNFSTGFGGTTPVNGDTLLFGASPTGTAVTDDISSLTVGGSNKDGIDFGTSASAYTISPSSTQTLTLNSSGTGVGISDLAQSGPALSGQSLSVPLVLGSTQTINVASLGSLTLSGLISGSFGLNKTGSGLLTLSSASNSFSGPIDVTAGTLSVASDANLGATTNNITLDGGALRITATGTLSSARGISLGDSNASTGGTIDAGTGTITYDGIIANNGGTNSLTKTGLGQLTLGNSETYTGSTYINQGTLVLDFSQSTAPSTNILSSSGTVVLGGTVTALNPETTGGPSIPTLNVQGKASTSNSQTIAGLTLNPGANFVTVAAGTSGSAVLNLGAITQNRGGQVDFTIPTGGQSSTNGITTTSANSTNGGSGTGILGGWAVVGGTSATAYATVSSGNIIAYTGYTPITSGVITSSVTSNYQVQASSGVQALTISSGTTDINTLSNSAAAATGLSTVTTTGGTLRLGAQGGMMIASGATGELQITGTGTLTAGGAANTAGEISILDFGTNGTTNGASAGGVFIDSVIANNGTGTVTLTVGQPGGSGTDALELGVHTNTYSGGTYVNSGRLRVDGSSSLGTGTVTIAPGGQVVFASSATPTNNFNIAGYGTSASSVALALGTSGSLGTSSTAATITLAGDSDISASGAVTIFDMITGGYSMTFGPGPGASGGSTAMVVTLSNANNNYTGNTIISEGTLKMGVGTSAIPNASGDGNVMLTSVATGSNSTLDLNGFSETINGLDSVVGLGGSGIVTNSATGTGTATLTVGNGGQSGVFVGTIINGSTAAVAIIKTGTGMETLSGANTYTGATTVEGGTLLAGVSNATTVSGAFGPSANGVTLGDAKTASFNLSPTLLEGVGSTGYTVSNAITVAADATSGTYTIGGANTSNTGSYTGNITLNEAVTLQAATGGTVDFNGGTWSTGGNALTIGSSGNAGTVELDNAITTAGGVTVNYGTLDTTSSLTSNLTVANSAAVSQTSGGTITGNVNVTSSAANTFGGVIAGSTTTFTQNGAGTSTFTGSSANTYGGLTTVSTGELDLDKTAGTTSIAGNVTVNGGTLKFLTNGQIASTATLTASSGAVNFNGTTETLTNLSNSGATIAYSGSVTIIDPSWSGGTNTVSGTATFGSLDISGGTNSISSGGILKVGGDASGTGLTFSGSSTPTITDSGTLALSASSNTGISTAANSGAGIAGLSSGSALISGSGTVSLGGVTQTINVATGGTSLEIDPTITNGGITKIGSGDLVLTGSNSYTAATTVAGGKLRLIGSIASGSTVTVGNGTATTAILAGTGTVSGNLSTTAAVSGDVAYLAPGVNTTGTRNDFGSAGTLNVGGNLSLGTGTNLDFDLSSSGLSGNDQIAVGGTLSIGTALTVNINELNSSLDTANKYQLITFTGMAPSLNGVTFTTNGTSSYTPVYSIDNGGEALDVAFSLPNLTPTAAYFNGQGTDLGIYANFDTTVSSGTVVGAALASTTNVSFNANRDTTVSTATLNTTLDVNSVTFGTGSGIHGGMTINGTGTLTLEATTANGNGLGNGITVDSGGGNNAINTALALDNDQTWTVTDSTSTLTVGGPVSGSHMLSTAGSGVVTLTNATGNSYSGGTSVGGTSTLLLANTSNSGAGTGSLTVNGGATLGGTGSYGTTGTPGAHFSITGTGTASGTLANVLVGLSSTGDTSTSTTLGLIAATGTISNANLTFNISATHPGALGSDPANSGTELVVGNSLIGFGAGVSLTLNVQNQPGIIGAYTPYVLIAGTLPSGGGGVSGSQYSGLTLGTVLENSGGITETIISNSSLALAFSGSVDQNFYGTNSYLVLYQNTNTGVDDIDVEVVPEPSTWAMILGGLAILVFYQRRKNRLG